jgi:hypothetical protein
MSLFDSFFSSDKKFTKQEINILDKCFNSISHYTDGDYDFLNKNIDNVLRKTHYGLTKCEVSYVYLNINDNNDYFSIKCSKYQIADRNQFLLLKNFYEEDSGGGIIKVPDISNFPSNILQVGWHGLGFITILNYENSGLITSNCENLIKNNSIKFLKNSHLGENKDVTFE